MIAFLTNWKTLLALLLVAGPVVSLFIPAAGAILAAFVKTKVGRIVVAALAVAIGVLLYTAYVETAAYNRGAAETKQRYEEQDRRVIDRANEAAIPVEECYDRGGEWLQEKGTCKLP